MIAEKRISDILFETEMNSHNTMSQVQDNVPQGHSPGIYMSLLRGHNSFLLISVYSYLKHLVKIF